MIHRWLHRKQASAANTQRASGPSGLSSKIVYPEMFLQRDKTSVKFSKTVLEERASFCSTATANPFVLASLSMKCMDNAIDWKRRSSAATMSVQQENDGRGRSVPLHRNPRRSPALIVC
jgi:hypothetical protein